jgi:hypothetical protein
VSVIVGLAAMSGCSALRNVIHPPSPAAQQTGAGAPAATQGIPVDPSTQAASCDKPAAGKYLGIGVAHTAQIAPTDQAMGITANMTSLYYNVGQTISMQTVASLCAQHMFPVIVLQDNNNSPAQIAAGADDKTLQGYALALGTMQSPVGVVFDHEFNGPWSSWGYTHTTPAEYVAAWQHIVKLFRDSGATNVTWIWNPNVSDQWTAPNLQAWYPGDAYVNWVGLDGYFYLTTDTYQSVFSASMRQVATFTKRPQIIVETGANPSSGRARAIASIFQGVQNTPGLLGMIYFDQNKTTVHNWYINDDPPALAAFKAGASSYMGTAG